jgi:hypothetical protein
MDSQSHDGQVRITRERKAESGKRIGRGEVYKDGWSPSHSDFFALSSQKFNTPTTHHTEESQISGISVSSYSIFISIPALLLSSWIPPAAVQGNYDEL